MRHALSLHGDDEKVEAGDDLLGVDQVVDAPPVALGRVSERDSNLNFTIKLLLVLSPSISIFGTDMHA